MHVCVCISNEVESVFRMAMDRCTETRREDVCMLNNTVTNDFSYLGFLSTAYR